MEYRTMYEPKATTVHICKMLKERNMTCKELSLTAGISEQCIKAWVLGKTKPRLRSLFAVSKAFGLMIDDVIMVRKAGKVMTAAESHMITA